MNSSFTRDAKDSAVALLISTAIAAVALLFFTQTALAQSAIRLAPDEAAAYSSFDLKVDAANPLSATVIRTDKLPAGSCGPKFVGRIEWGDGSVTEQPTYTTMECGFNTSVSASHNYKAAGNYLVKVTLDGQLRIQQTISVSGGDTNWIPPNPTPAPVKDTNWIHAFNGDCAWWKIGGLISPCNSSDGGGLNATALPRPTGGDTNAVPVSPTPAPSVNGKDTNWITYAPQAVSGFVKGVTSAITRPIMGVIPFVKGMFGMNGQGSTGDDFANLPAPRKDDFVPSVRSINDIKATVVNQSLTRESRCQVGQGSDKFDAYVITNQGEIAIYDCSNGTTPTDYAKVIVDNLSRNHGFSGLTVDALLKKAFQIGGASGTKPGFTNASSTVNSDTSVVNNLDIGLQIKVTDKDGRTVKDWSANNVVIDSTDQVYLRWNADKFTQCLPFFADNGQYAFAKLNSKLVAGNTETEKYNLTERTGPYLLECASRVNSYDVQTAIIYVTVRSNATTPIISGLPVEPSSRFEVAVNSSNTLNVSITRTVPSGECGPKYVGTIDWGDGTVEPQPESVTRECGLFSSTTATHTYKTGGQYTVSVKLDGVTAMVTQVTVFAMFDAPN